MDVTQIGLGIVLLAVATLMLAGQSVSDSRLFLYFLTGAALVLTALATVISVLRNRPPVRA